LENKGVKKRGTTLPKKEEEKKCFRGKTMGLINDEHA